MHPSIASSSIWTSIAATEFQEQSGGNATGRGELAFLVSLPKNAGNDRGSLALVARDAAARTLEEGGLHGFPRGSSSDLQRSVRSFGEERIAEGVPVLCGPDNACFVFCLEYGNRELGLCLATDAPGQPLLILIVVVIGFSWPSWPRGLCWTRAPQKFHGCMRAAVQAL